MCKVSSWNGSIRILAEDVPWNQGGLLLLEVEEAEVVEEVAAALEVPEEAVFPVSGAAVSLSDEALDNIFCLCFLLILLFLFCTLMTIIHLLPWLIS